MNPVILLVDDEPAVIDGLIRGLRKLPCTLMSAGSGPEAIQILSENEIDVIVADEMMPEMSGSELLAYARKNHPEVLRIMLTGHASVTSAMNAIYEGWVYQYLHKPCEAVDLASAIHNGLLLQSLQSRAEGPHVMMSGAEQSELLSRMAKSET